MSWHNADGLDVEYGGDQRAKKVNRFRAVNTFGARKQAVCDVDLTKIASGAVTYLRDLNNDGTNDGFNTGDFYFPANASVESCTLYVVEAAAGGTSIKIGTFQVDGTAIDDDFLVTATEGVKANLDTVGARTFGAGVGVATTAETAGVGTVDAFPAITGSGTWTAGKLRVVINYVDVLADA